MTAPSEDSDQPRHPPSLMRIFSVHMKVVSVLSYPYSAQRRLIRLDGCLGWSESSLDAHAILLVLSWGGWIIRLTYETSKLVFPLGIDIFNKTLYSFLSNNKTPIHAWSRFLCGLGSRRLNHDGDMFSYYKMSMLLRCIHAIEQYVFSTPL